MWEYKERLEGRRVGGWLGGKGGQEYSINLLLANEGRC